MISVIALNLVIFIKVSLPKPVIYKGKNVAQWAADLNGGDQKTRDEATLAFKELRARAVPDLIRLLRGKDSWFRKEVFAFAPKLPSPIRRLLLRFVKPIYWPDVHHTAAIALGIIGPDAKEAVSLLDEALRDANLGVRTEAAFALAEIGKDAIPFLIADLKHPSPDVRHSAIYALFRMETNALPALPALMERFSDDYEHIRAAAAIAAGRTGQEGRKVLLQAIADKDGIARSTAINAAKMMHGADEFVPPLLVVLKDTGVTNRRAATLALGAVNPWKKEVVAAMIGLLDDADAEVRLGAVKNLGKAPWKAHAAIPSLNELLNDPDEPVRTAARETLDKINSTPALQPQSK